MAVLLTDLIELFEEELVMVEGVEELITLGALSPAEARLILAALKRFEKCDGKHG